MAAAQERQARNYKRSRRGPVKYHVGDLVYKANPHVGKEAKAWKPLTNLRINEILENCG